MRIGSLFSGYGGLEMGVQAVLGGSTAWVSDIDPGACKILAHRFPDVPNLGDISAVDWSAVEPVDVLTGGFPCQDVSCAGLRKGLRPDTRSGLWTQMAYAIDQLRPSLVVAENVRGLLSAEAHSDLEPCPWCVGDGGGVPLRALGAVLGNLADIGYGPAVRRWERLTRPAPAPVEPGKTGQPRLSPAFVEWMQGLPAGWVTDVPGLTRNEQLKALGNGVVPQQAAAALRLLLTAERSAAA